MSMNTDKHAPGEPLADFGYRQVPRGEKKVHVRGVFDSVAERYDLMNDLMSLGLHRFWKAFTAARSGLKPGQRALDVAAGSGDLARALARRVGPTGRVIVTDVNASMLERGRDRLTDSGVVGNVAYLQADAEALPFRPGSFHCVTIGFGLRNVTDRDAALASMFAVLKPGGRLLILEFSTPRLALLRPVYDWYSFAVLPLLGQWTVGDAASYRYLAESIRLHPDQDTLREQMLRHGFERCEYHNLSGGIVALHVGYRL